MKVVMFICFIMGTVGTLLGAFKVAGGSNESLLAGIAFLVVGFIILATSKGRKKKKALKAEQKARGQEIEAEKVAKGYMLETVMTHMAGLPIPESAVCKVHLKTNGVAFESDNNTTYDLSFYKITGVTIKTDKEIQNSYVSSVGGAIGGAVLFGPLGAMVGGRAKKKTDTTIRKYLIFSYQSEEKTDFVSFDCTYENRASEFVKAFQNIPKEQKQVSL